MMSSAARPPPSAPTMTPDGKYFFYISWGSSNWASYWVKADFIEKLRPKD